MAKRAVKKKAASKSAVPTAGVNNEAQKTEPDKNTYLVLPQGQPGADPNYDYGTHFLFQGHEAGTPGYITRINLDVKDPAHRITLLNEPGAVDANGVQSTGLRSIDGSNYDILRTVELPAGRASGLELRAEGSGSVG